MPPPSQPSKSSYRMRQGLTYQSRTPAFLRHLVNQERATNPFSATISDKLGSSSNNCLYSSDDNDDHDEAVVPEEERPLVVTTDGANLPPPSELVVPQNSQPLSSSSSGTNHKTSKVDDGDDNVIDTTPDGSEGRIMFRRPQPSRPKSGVNNVTDVAKTKVRKRLHNIGDRQNGTPTTTTTTVAMNTTRKKTKLAKNKQLLSFADDDGNNTI
ncbi:hypothetical protein EV182_001377 [Spiromyces aspiralis]|uniref:Uncharacterized protein n=1 Tax=Spiromyces aspiralis TaxID=68401 RepID=A0ACC1I0V6_9FUNG|nr:hypothetical protein EV182_001377 [Spiromyces aspiralis]